MKTIYLTDSFMSTGADPDGVDCFVTGEKTHYFDVYHDAEGNHLYVGLNTSGEILSTMHERAGDLSVPLQLSIQGVDIEIIDTRFYKTFYSTYSHPDYAGTGLEDDSRWLTILPPEWSDAEENEDGIATIALKREPMGLKTVGYNGILKGDKVDYEGKEHTVVMVSRLGDFGLSLTGTLPYTKRVSPVKVRKLSV